MESVRKQKAWDTRGIRTGGPSACGLVRATPWVVSGQLATEACRNDAMGYGVVTDYWPQGSVPTVSCQMHQVMTICDESGMLAGPYCPPEHLSQRGVVMLPQGHPLARFLNTEYQGVLNDYLGRSLTGGGGGTWSIHNE